MGQLPKKATKNDIETTLEWRVTYNKFKSLALNMFEWEGLEELGIKEEDIEKTLFDEGRALFFEDRYYGLMCLPCMSIGKNNPYGRPVKYKPTGFGDEFSNFDTYEIEENCVLVQNNKLQTPTRDLILTYTNRLVEIQRTIDVNVKTLKMPFVVACDDKTLLSFKKVMSDVENYEPIIYTDKGMNATEAIKVLPTGVKPFTKELMDYKKQVECELLTALGINNSNTEKRERLITDEVNSNNEFIEFNVDTMLTTRELACEQINEMFGTNISVKLRREEELEDANISVGSDTLPNQEQA